MSQLPVERPGLVEQKADDSTMSNSSIEEASTTRTLPFWVGNNKENSTSSVRTSRLPSYPRSYQAIPGRASRVSEEDIQPDTATERRTRTS